MGRMLFFMGLPGFHASFPAAAFSETSGFMMKSLGGFSLCPPWMASRLPEGPACRKRKRTDLKSGHEGRQRRHESAGDELICLSADVYFKFYLFCFLNNEANLNEGMG